ncbi:hypothetical protein V6N13_129400 [Hibiscus sabdariffa]
MSFPELQQPKRKYGKRYISLFDLQDKALSEAEKKKSDKAINKSKRGRKDVDKGEVDGSSPTDSDIARDEEDIVADIVQAEERELQHISSRV